MPPMFAPECMAEMVIWAAEHAPREMLIGRPSVQAVWAQKFIPGLLDLYLGKQGYQPQMVNKPNEQQGDILFGTLAGDPGAHGPYRDKERGRDLQMRLRTHLPTVGLASGLAALGTLTLMRGGSRAGRQGR